jgi:hypothetical protein
MTKSLRATGQISRIEAQHKKGESPMRKLKIVLLLSMIALMLGFPAKSTAYSLYWSKVFVSASTEGRCMDFAYHVASQKLQHVRRSNLDVNGSTASGYVSITCVGVGQRALAVVMAVSDSDPGARKLRDDIAAAIQRERSFD